MRMLQLSPQVTLIIVALWLLTAVNVAAFAFLNDEGFVADAGGHWPLQRETGAIAAIAAGDPVARVRGRASYS